MTLNEMEIERDKENIQKAKLLKKKVRIYTILWCILTPIIFSLMCWYINESRVNIVFQVINNSVLVFLIILLFIKFIHLIVKEYFS